MKTNYGVYYVPTSEGKIFANLQPELVYSFDKENDAYEECDRLNDLYGNLDELHKGYEVHITAK